MSVVSDTSPICYLVVIGHVDILPNLFEAVAIPEAVKEELRHLKAPSRVREWIGAPPPWLEIRRAPSGSREPDLARLHAGEREAVLLAEALQADLLVDEKLARDAALSRGLAVTGLLGLLKRAGERGLLSVSDAVRDLRKTSFRASPKLYEEFLVQWKE